MVLPSGVADFFEAQKIELLGWLFLYICGQRLSPRLSEAHSFQREPVERLELRLELQPIRVKIGFIIDFHLILDPPQATDDDPQIVQR
jgi:hypothetical protein